MNDNGDNEREIEQLSTFCGNDEQCQVQLAGTSQVPARAGWILLHLVLASRVHFQVSHEER